MVAILITAGPTREHLDDVRFLSNGSSGRMGCALAGAAIAAGHPVELVLGPCEARPPAAATVHPVVSGLEMLAAAQAGFARADVVIAAAAVSDWRPASRAVGKPPRAPGGFCLELVPNPDIVATLAAARRAPGARHRTSVGFALESTAAGLPAALARGRQKLVAKDLDLVVVNLHDALGSDDSEVVLGYADGRDEALPRQDKARTAARIVAAAVALWGAGRTS
jgi:phosphopantothenoylcysteine decarboxylase/phosphopantothenate--cysteine ligase